MFSLSLPFFLLFSCSDNDTQISATSSQVVFEYDDFESPPKMRLVAFAQVEGDVNKVSSVTVEHSQDSLYWKINSPQSFQNGQHKWAGYTNMVMPQGKDISQGQYELIYEDLQEEEGQASFVVFYPKELTQALADEALHYMGSDFRQRVVLYDKDETMIYCDTKRNTWNTAANVLQDFGSALYYRYYYTAATGKYSCLFPMQSITEFK